MASTPISAASAPLAAAHARRSPRNLGKITPRLVAPAAPAQLAAATARRVLPDGGVERPLDPIAQREVLHRPAHLADEVVMVFGEVLGKLVERVIGTVHESADHTRLLEQCGGKRLCPPSRF